MPTPPPAMAAPPRGSGIPAPRAPSRSCLPGGDRTRDTEAVYARAGRSLLRAFCRDMARAGSPLERPWLVCVDPAATRRLAAWFLERAARRRWVPATFLWNRRALARALEAACERANILPDPGALSLLATLPVPRNLPRRSRRCSARKARCMPPGPLERLRERLASGTGRYDRLAALWLVAQRLTGLRPSEWGGARWIETALADGSPCGVLAVPNGKVNARMRRGNGPWRHLVFLGPELAARREAITAFLTELERVLAPGTEAPETGRDGNQAEAPAAQARGRARGKAFSRAYLAVRGRVRRANLALWGEKGWDGSGRTITLYSGRHQFAADAKSAGGVGLSRAELAALMGHASCLSALQHYAGRQVGSGRGPETLPRALASEAARVREGRTTGCPVTARERAPKHPRHNRENGKEAVHGRPADIRAGGQDTRPGGAGNDPGARDG